MAPNPGVNKTYTDILRNTSLKVLIYTGLLVYIFWFLSWLVFSGNFSKEIRNPHNLHFKAPIACFFPMFLYNSTDLPREFGSFFA
jgi:hypothetical protein